MSKSREQFIALQCKVFKEKFALLMDQYERIQEQIASTVNQGEIPVLEDQREKVEEKLERTIKDMEALGCDQSGPQPEKPQPDYNRRYLDLEQRLCLINLKNVDETLAAIPNLLDEEGNCSALLIFEESLTMGGEYCAERIRGKFRAMTGSVDPWRVEHRPERVADEMALLKGLANYLGMQPGEQSFLHFQQDIIQKICKSLHSGRVILIEFWGWDCLSHSQALLQWLLSFWRALAVSVTEVSKGNECRGVKLVAVVYVDGKLDKGYLKGTDCCTVEKFEYSKVLRMMLEPWTVSDIKRWLVQWGFPGPQIDLIAQRVYRNSQQGLPCVIKEQLLKVCCRQASSP